MNRMFYLILDLNEIYTIVMSQKQNHESKLDRKSNIQPRVPKQECVSRVKQERK
jgi:hypothetical protein